MKIDKCKICGGASDFIFAAKIMNKYDASYFLCPRCGFMQTEEPCWLEESYKRPINLSDTGLLARNIYYAQLSASLIFALLSTEGSFLDYAGGYGVYVRLMRDTGFNFYWNDAYTQNIFASGFEYDLKPPESKIAAVTSFETFEHFVSPLDELEKLLNISQNIIFSTRLLPPGAPPQPDAWPYYGFEHGQHISFFSLKTLQFIAGKYGLNFYSYGSEFHFFTARKISNLYFKFLCRFSKYIYEFIVKKRMKSLTGTDSLYLAGPDGNKK